MVKLFIKHVLGIQSDHEGLYGKTSAYYGTVEQQGRLTLHLHLLLWITNSLSPQDVRERIMDVNSDFQMRIIAYLEGTHQGEFIGNNIQQVQAEVDFQMSHPDYKDPTQTLPEAPPPRCSHAMDTSCEDCKETHEWKQQFKNVVNDLLLKSNMHKCRNHCKVKGICKARFPREVILQTNIDMLTGYIYIKKLESWLNTFTPTLTYLL
ncbi:hypothetical protein OE88DRAFT_1711412 [Heliocybe sulcata]|uniref:Helitron helicase-like domain-containing protein n=1 Tax=Heliocybe sulcata TaxID=5364 RepID=A0A5C3NIE7_9AGAM|nr:hypothetical protein OE88DRAFT_1711412 [Heliocybe sulcata]